MHILIVDDSTVMRWLIERNLLRAGLRLTTVHHAAHGLEALACLRTQPQVQLILTDINMPVMNGLEFLERRQVESLAPHAATVVLTIEPTGPLLRRAISLGAHACLTKPFSSDQLRRTLLPLLGIHHAPSPTIFRSQPAAVSMPTIRF